MIQTCDPGISEWKAFVISFENNVSASSSFDPFLTACSMSILTPSANNFFAFLVAFAISSFLKLSSGSFSTGKSIFKVSLTFWKEKLKTQTISDIQHKK